jgi:hypothetical protein
MEYTEELIRKIELVEENRAVRLAPNLVMWKEGSSYDVDVTNRQFDELEKIMSEIEGSPYYLIDLSLAKRPSPEIVQLVEERLRPFRHRFKHSSVYTGKNHLMLLGIRFYFIKFDFPSYSAHSNLKNVLKAFG